MDAVPAWVWLAVICMLACGWWWASTRIRRGNMRRGRAARQAESDAERLLRAKGFRVEDRQATRTFDIDVDGEPVEVMCRADLLVRRRRRRYVAEVKSSGRTSNPAHPDTRRQLLEYRLAFDVDGVLLVDMAQRNVVEVGFPFLRR